MISDYLQQEEETFQSNLLLWSKWTIEDCNSQICAWVSDAQVIVGTNDLHSKSIWNLNPLSKTAFRQTRIALGKNYDFLPCQYWYYNLTRQQNIRYPPHVIKLVFIWCKILSHCVFSITNGTLGNLTELDGLCVVETLDDKIDRISRKITDIAEMMHISVEHKNMFELVDLIHQNLK